MPVVMMNRYTCPVTGLVEYGFELPPRWFVIQDEVFAGEAQVPLAQYVVDHPTVGFTELIARLQQHPATVRKAIHAGDKLPA